MNYQELSEDTKNNLDKETIRIFDYLEGVFKKQDRFLSFEEVYGDGTIFRPYNKEGARVVYNCLLETLAEQLKDCSWCDNGYILDYEKTPCGHCTLKIEEIREFINEKAI
jgi:hypothetical protein